MLRPSLYFGTGFLLFTVILICFGNFYAMLVILFMATLTLILNLFSKNTLVNSRTTHKLTYGTLTILIAMLISLVFVPCYMKSHSLPSSMQNPEQIFSVTGVIKSYHPTKTGINYEAKVIFLNPSLQKRTHTIFIFSSDSLGLKIGENFSGNIALMPDQKFVNTDSGNGIFGRFRATSPLITTSKNPFPITRFFALQKEIIIKSIKKILPNKSGDLLIAIILGTTDLLDSSDKMILSRSGISHVTAVSGLHVFILCNCFLMVSRFFHIPPKITAILIALFLLFFVGITGFSSSITRAGIMMMVAQIATLVGEKSDALNTLGVSVVFILLINPYSVLNLGFILSFGATLSIIVFTKPLEQLLTQNLVVSHVASDFYCKLIKSISSSISVYILLAPILVYLFGTFPFLAIITNIIIAPMLPLIVILSFGVAVFSVSPIFTPIAMLLGFFANIALSILLGIASIISNSSLAVVSFHHTLFYAFIVLFFCSIIGAICFLSIKHRFLLFIVTGCSLVGFMLFSIYYMNGKSQIIALNDNNCVLIKQPDSFFILGSPTSTYELEQLVLYLKNNYITDVSGFIFANLDNTTVNTIKKISEIADIQNLVNMKEERENNIGYLQLSDDITLDISKTDRITFYCNYYVITKLLNDDAFTNLPKSNILLNDKNIVYVMSSKIKPTRYKFVTVFNLY